MQHVVSAVLDLKDGFGPYFNHNVFDLFHQRRGSKKEETSQDRVVAINNTRIEAVPVAKPITQDSCYPI